MINTHNFFWGGRRHFYLCIFHYSSSQHRFQNTFNFFYITTHHAILHISALCTTALMEYRDFDDGLPKKNRILQARLRLTVLSTERLSVCQVLWIIWAFLLHTHACKKITVLFFQNTCCMQSFLLVCLCLPVFLLLMLIFRSFVKTNVLMLLCWL